MHIARAKAARTPPAVGTRLRGADSLRLTRVPTVGGVRAAFARAMCIARPAGRLGPPVFTIRGFLTLRFQRRIILFTRILHAHSWKGIRANFLKVT